MRRNWRMLRRIRRRISRTGPSPGGTGVGADS
jgi:hypothetical protein